MDEDEDLKELRVAYDPSASGSHRSTVPPAGQLLPNTKKRQRRYAVRKHLREDVSVEGLEDGGKREVHEVVEDIDQEVLLAFHRVGHPESNHQPDMSGSQSTPHSHSEVYTSRRRDVLGSVRKMSVPAAADPTASPIETQQHPVGVDADMLAAYNAHMASRMDIESEKKNFTSEKSPSRGGRRRMSTPGGRGQRHRRIPLPSPLGTAPPFSLTQNRIISQNKISYAPEIAMEASKQAVQTQFLTNIPAPARTNHSRFRSRLPTTLTKQIDTAEERIGNSTDGSPSFLMLRVESHEMEMGKMKCFCQFVDTSSRLSGKLFLIAVPTLAITSFLESDAQEKNIIIERPWLHLDGSEDELPLIVSLGEISHKMGP